MNDLNEKQTKIFKGVCSKAYKAYDAGDFKTALRLFYQAWVALPKPQTEYQESGWVLTAIGDTYFRLGQYQQATEALNSALHCPGIEDNPFSLMRLGQAHYDNNEKPIARKFLLKAYRLGGAELFNKEGAIYIEAIKDLIQ